MRDQALTGYLLHQKPYQERRALYYLFTETHGLVNGVGKKGAPLFRKIQLFANGKRSLKTFSQIQPVSIQTGLNLPNDLIGSTQVPALPNSLSKNNLTKNNASGQLFGQNLYAGFYLNEVLWKLLAPEDVMSSLWHAYEISLSHLQQPLNNHELKILLRHFESILFAEFGCLADFSTDSKGQQIYENKTYRFIIDEGFCVDKICENDGDKLDDSNNKDNYHINNLYSGASIMAIADYKDDYFQNDRPQTQLDSVHLQIWSKLHKQIIDHLLDYKTLQSRELWKQFVRYM